MSSALEHLQEAVASRLQEIPELAAADLPVLTQRRGNLEQQAKTALSKVRGCIVVYPPSGSINSQNPQGPYLSTVRIQVRLTTWPEKYDGPSSLELAELALRYLHHYRTPDGCQLLASTAADNPDPIDHSQYNIVDTHFVTSFGLAPLT